MSRTQACQRPSPAAAGTCPAPLRLSILGKSSAGIDRVEVVLTSRKCWALLGCIVLSDGCQETRERLIGLLWSESDELRARASLRQALYDVRLALERAGFDGLHSTKLAVAVEPGRIEVDVWAVLDMAKAGAVHPLLLETERPVDSLLAELETVDPAFRVWLLAKRQAIHDRIVRHLELALRNGQGEPAERRDLAQALMNLDPTHEEAARMLMRLRADAGDVGAALSIYKRLWDFLEEEYDVEPSEATQNLAAAIRMAQPLSSDAGGPAVPAAAVAAPVAEPADAGRRLPASGSARLMVTVGGFDATGVGPDRAYLVQGFRRELIANLVRFREWVVRDGGLAADAPQGQEYVVEATALQGALEARLIVTLRDAQTHEYVWSNQFRLVLADWVDSQQLLVQRIATALNIYLSSSRLALIRQRPNEQLKAYDRWLYGQSRLYSWDPAGFHEATAIFQGIIAEVPEFSPAHASLAQAYNTVHFIHPGVFKTADRMEQALAYATNAARLDPVDSRGQLSLGWAHAMARHHDLAELHHGLAGELNENDPWTATSVALGYAMRGQHEQAREAAGRSIRFGSGLGPQHWSYHLQVRFMTGDYAGSIDAAQPAGDVIPTSAAWKIAALGHLGVRDEAIAEARRYVERIRAGWFGSEPATDDSIARWTMHCFPIKRREDWEHFRDGLAAGGLQVSRLAHESW